ncbi:MAG: hypothetical protein FWD64_02710 [Acidobacteriaceae bacterium]|nr:hypothetical protein [Acidobacteriaceae bacterium]
MTNLPTAAQLAQTRLKRWHHDTQPLQTLEALRHWIAECGLVLYAPCPQIAAPAPTFIEAVLGAANPAPTLAELEAPRSLMSRLVAEGTAIPLHLLGTQAGTEAPDFLASPATLPFLFTLRGDKLWKQPPAVSGAARVTPLALAAHNLLAQKGRLAASELAVELGNEVTEAAVLRALTDLWSHLRVLPLPQIDGAPTLWELTTARFTKQIKDGANAGQPRALSALVSLYLTQAVLPTEEEAEIFLSPVAARSRVREVIHALIAARQLETVAVEGKTTLHVAGALPEFEPAAEPVVEVAEPIAIEARDEQAPRRPRIGKFVPRQEFAKKPDRREGDRFAARPPRKEFERRPFSRDRKPDFTKPWEEERRRPGGEHAEDRPFRKPRAFDSKERSTEQRDSGGSRPAFSRAKPRFDKRDSRGGEGFRGDFKARPPKRFSAEGKPEDRTEQRGERKPFRAERRPFSGSDDRPKRFARKDSAKGPRPDPTRDAINPRHEWGTQTKPKRFGDKRSEQGDFDGTRPAFTSRKPRFDSSRDGSRPFREDRKPFRDADGKPKRFAKKDSSERPRQKKEFSSAKPFGKKPFGKSAGRPGKPAASGARDSRGRAGQGAGRKPAGKSGAFGKFMGGKKKFSGKRGKKSE